MADELKKSLLSYNPGAMVSHGYGEGTGERGRWVYDKVTQTFVPFEQKRVDVDAPFVIQDTIEPVMSMTGSDNWHDSKTSLRQEYKEMGFVETGHVPLQGPKKIDREQRYREIRDTVEKSMNQIRWNEVPVSERERQKTIEEEREWKAYQKRMKG